MKEELAMTNIQDRLIQETRRVVQQMADEEDRVADLMSFARNIRSWINKLAPDEKEKVLQLLDSFLNPELAPSNLQSDEELKWFTYLVKFIRKAPPLL